MDIRYETSGWGAGTVVYIDGKPFAAAAFPGYGKPGRLVWGYLWPARQHPADAVADFEDVQRRVDEWVRGLDINPWPAPELGVDG